MEQILVINGSARVNGDTRMMIEAHLNLVSYDLINLAEYQIEPFNYENKYSINDDFEKFTNRFINYDTIIFATPVYWYAMSGRLKILFDRMTAWVSTDKTIGRKLKGKSISVIAVGTDAVLPDGFIIPFTMTAGYFEMNFIGCEYFCIK